MLPVIDGIEIPESIAIPCAEKGFKLRYARKCNDCPHFDGIAQMTPETTKDGRALQWHERYVIRCKHPIERRCANLAVIEE